MVDASVLADSLVRRAELPHVIHASLGSRVQGPAILPAEVTSALRRLLFHGKIAEPVAATARQRLASMRLRLHPFWPYADRIWQLRANLTVYDAWYVAIAERLAQPLVTADGAILSAPELKCELIDARWG